MAAPIKVRDYAAEYARRMAKAVSAGFTGYSQQRRMQRYGPMGSQTPGVRPSATRRIQDAVGYQDEVAEDWEAFSFSSSRVDRARYSPSRRELQVAWKNAPGGTPYPPYIYDGVDPATWTNFCLSGSPGSYVNSPLGTFPYRSAPDTIGDL